jgi:hypothetical protein
MSDQKKKYANPLSIVAATIPKTEVLYPQKPFIKPESCFLCKYKCDLVCRRYPPVQPYKYPTIRSDDWCGEFKGRTDE